jgi:hypothetical protein
MDEPLFRTHAAKSVHKDRSPGTGGIAVLCDAVNT